MSYDTTPLRDMQKEKEEAAADLFKKAREAQAAAARMAELRQLAQEVELLTPLILIPKVELQFQQAPT